MTTTAPKETTTMSTAADHRQQAAQHAANAAESFDRCDTDGFVSQWASDLNSHASLLRADLAENGGTAEFLALFTLDGEWVPAQRIDGQYGARWMVLDAEGNRTGEYLPYNPVRRNTIAKHGYVEGWVRRPATVKMGGGQRSITSVHPKVVAADRPWDAPLEIVATDAWEV